MSWNIAIGYRILSISVREICEDTWIAVAKHKKIEVYSDISNVNELQTKTDKKWLLWVDIREDEASGVYVHIPHLLEFLSTMSEGCWTDENHCLLCDRDRRSIRTLHPHMYNCDYMGCVNFVPQNRSIDHDKILCFGHMSPEAMDAYHISLRIPPIVPRRSKEDNKWTLVTGFFDLCKMPDVTSSSRTLEHYLHHSRATLSRNQNLVIFCEEETYPFFKEERENFGLLEKTKFHIVDFNDFPLCKYRDRIVENRKTHPPHDDRNNPSYYLLCMARYAMLKQAISENVFASTHFCWINICISRMGLRNVELLNRGLSLYRDKFSTVWIDYISQKDIETSYNFICPGRCSMCSGFFTGSAEIMEAVCTLIEEKFMYYLELGYGHADEQLYSPVYFENPHLFEQFFGDYQQMITNYTEMIENPYTTLQFLIPRAKLSEDYQVLYRACKAVFDGYTAKHYTLPSPVVVQLLENSYTASSKII